MREVPYMHYSATESFTCECTEEDNHPADWHMCTDCEFEEDK